MIAINSTTEKYTFKKQKKGWNKISSRSNDKKDGDHAQERSRNIALIDEDHLLHHLVINIDIIEERDDLRTDHVIDLGKEEIKREEGSQALLLRHLTPQWRQRSLQI
jgi:hypothetical protein